jgi:RHS repeat-associated protein
LRKRDGRHIAFAYDTLNRLTAKTYPDGGARAVYYGYDLRNLPLFARFDSPSGEGVTNSYDGFGRLASSSTSISGVTRMLSYGYDDAGNRISIKHPDGTWFGMWYDALGRRYYIHANNVLGMAMLGFAPHGGLSWVGRVGIASYIGFDAVQRPSSLAQAAYTPAAATDVAFSFARNPAGQITSLTRDNDAYAWTGHYAANRAYTTNGLNQYSAAGNAAFGYDANGNLTSDGATTFTYDVENRLVGAAGARNSTLSYDPLGRLYQVTLGTSTTRFLYDGDALVAEYDGSNTLIRRHAHWEGADVPVATFDVSGGTGLGTLRYLFADHQGSIIAEANGSGAVTAINRYDEYGIPASSNVGRFQYTGQAWLPELGMYYYKARIYSPTLGRFMQTDPVGYQGGINLYAYVGDDPVNATDPTGTTIHVDDEQLRRRLLTQINSLTRSKYTFDRNGNLRRESRTGGSGRSAYYDRRLMQAIGNQRTISISQAETARTASGISRDVDRQCGGGCSFHDPQGNSRTVVSGNERVITTPDGLFRMTPAAIVMHELVGHDIPRMVGRDTGNAVANENKVRAENGMPLRPADPTHEE